MSSNTDQKIKKPDEDVVSKPQPQNNDKLSTSPKSLLKQIAKINEVLPPSHPDDSPTIHFVPLQTSQKGYSRRSSGILATVNTPKTLIQKFLSEAPTETPVIPSNMTGNSSSLEKSSVPLPAKVMDSYNYRDLSVTASDLEEEPVLGSESITSEEKASKLKDSHVGFQKNSSKGLKRPRRQITAKDIADGVKQSQDAEEDDEISLHKPKIVMKIRKKITADDLAMGIKQSQEAAAATEAKPTDITEMSTSDSSLGFLTVNSENTEHFLDTTNVAVEDSSDESDLSEDCSNHGNKQSKSDAVQSEKNPPNSSEREKTWKIDDVNRMCLEESLKVLRDASDKHASKEKLQYKPEKPNNSVISQPRKSTSLTETIPSFQLSQRTTKDLTNLSDSENSVKHTSHVNLANSSSSLSFLKKLTVSLTDISCSGNQQSMTASTKNFLNSTKNIKSRDDAALSDNKGKEKDRFIIRENKEISDSPSSSDSEFKTSRKITYDKDIKSKQDAAVISSNRNSDCEDITEEKPSELKEVTPDIGSLKLKEKSTNCEETKIGQSDVATDKDTFVEDLAEMPLETKDVEYTSEFIQTFSLESLNEETVSSNVSQNKTDEKIEVRSKNEMVAHTQEKQNIADQHESKTNYGRMLEGQMELNEEPVKDFVPVNNVVLELHEEMVVIEDENEVIEVQDEPIVEILDEEYIRLHNEDLIGINREAAFVYQTENKDTKNLQKENQMTLNEDIEKKHDQHAEKIPVDVQDDKMKPERETRKEKELSSNVEEIVVTGIDEARRKSGVGKNNENVLQDKVDVTTDEKEISVTKSKVEVSTAQDEEEDIPLFEVESLSEDEISEIDRSTKGENRSVSQSEGGEEDIPLFEVESLSQVEISKVSGEVDESAKGENASVHQCESDTSMPHVKTDIELSLDKSETKSFQNEDDIGKIQDKSEDNMAQNKTEIDMILVESKADGKQSNKTGVTQDESEIYFIQNERKTGMTQNEGGVTQDKSKDSVIQDESKAWVTQEESEAGKTQDESEADVAQEKSETGVPQDGSEADALQSENVDGESQIESKDYVSEIESKDSTSEAESEVAVTQHKHNLSGIQEEFETGAIQNDSKISVTQDRSKSSMIQHEVDVIPEESEAGETQEESKAGEIQEERKVGETREESENSESQEESEDGETQGESEAGETQEESEAGETQEESEAGKTQDESEAGKTQDESETGKTQDESEAGKTQDESEAGETQDEIEAGKTQDESEAGESQEENEAGKTQEGNKTATKLDKPDLYEIMAGQVKYLTLTRDRKRSEVQCPANVMQDEDMPATTNDFDFLNEIKNDDREEQEFNIKVKSVSKNKSTSRVKELAENEIQVDDEAIFQQNIEHSKKYYLRGKESQTTPSCSSLQQRSSVANPSVSPKPSKSQDLSLKRRGTKRKSASDHTTEAEQVSAHSVSEKLRRRSRETNLSKTRSYRIVDSLSGIGDSLTISNQAIKQLPPDIGTVPNENQRLQKTDQQISGWTLFCFFFKLAFECLYTGPILIWYYSFIHLS
ncbi:CAP-Gly domain-containing linker protein 1 [Octopus bimaculoides]|uniref:CAP-Gly domain-containing linker protein 1 n=1 Tax=Octopus bimaculoides TaxID=37653 RepID=UPI00071CB9DD|nr:CAP-Gly domain-containing linker protein 1 [Octopus bimaculoides]|eukprot:XP_014788816.1 PREDICTED: CAP-Gly domain-containing linker protein 1-like [Octopus bimaculoides]